MDASLFLIFNHQFTDAQREDAITSLCASRVIDMPPEIVAIWGDIPPDLYRIYEYLKGDALLSKGGRSFKFQ